MTNKYVMLRTFNEEFVRRIQNYQIQCYENESWSFDKFIKEFDVDIDSRLENEVFDECSLIIAKAKLNIIGS